MDLEKEIASISINDLKDKYFDNHPMSHEEKLALSNFDQYRIKRLNAAKNDAEFKLVYVKIQAMANLSSYRYFLNPSLLQNI